MKKLVSIFMLGIMLLVNANATYAEDDSSTISSNVKSGVEVTLSASTIKIGYAVDELYNDHNSGAQKPTTIPDQIVDVSMDISGTEPQSYTIKLVDEEDSVIWGPSNGTIEGGNQSVIVTVPGNTIGGHYFVEAVVGEEVVKKPILVVNNLAKSAVITTQVPTKEGKSILNVKDDLYSDWLTTGDHMPSENNPHEIILSYGSSVSISHVSIWANYGNQHSIKKAEIKYYDQEDNSWKYVANQAGDTTLNFDWSTVDGGNGSIRAKYDIVLNQVYNTSKIKLIIKESNVCWNNVSVITELQTWGYEQLTNDTDIISHVTATTNMVTSTGDITSLTDSNESTSWIGIHKSDGYITLSPGMDGSKYKNTVNRSIRLYSPTATPNISSIKVRVQCAPDTGYYENLTSEITPQWTFDGEKYICDIPLDILTVTPDIQIMINGITGQTFELSGVSLYGELLEANIGQQAKVYKNNALITADAMIDSNIGTTLRQDWANSPNPDEYIIDFSPKRINTDRLYYLTNFPEGQGVKSVKLEYWTGTGWTSVIGQQDFDWKSNNQIREAQEISFAKISSSKFRISCLDNNMDWGAYIFAQLFVTGHLDTNAQSVADAITIGINPNKGQAILSMPILDSDISDGYTVSLASSSNEGILALDGNITSPEADATVAVIYRVTDNNNTEDVGITQSIDLMIPARLQEGYNMVYPTEDTTSFIKNPAMGWVQYVEGFECREHEESDNLCMIDPTDIEYFWQEIDSQINLGLKPSTLYMRMQWSWFEPQEGQYAWNNPNSELSQLIEGAKQRDLQLAFRVLVDSTDAGFQSTPQWVFDAGATGYWSSALATDPYIDSPVFMAKLDNFLEAMGEEYNKSESNVAFIDGMGLGNWGEMHDIRTNHGKSVSVAVEDVLKLYDQYFPDVLLGAQVSSEGDVVAINTYNYMVRRDSFGSIRWLSDNEKNKLLTHFNNGVPVYAENCFHHFQSRTDRWKKGGITYGDDIFDTMKQMLDRVSDDAIQCRANTLDIRVLEDARLWVREAPDRINELAIKLGYRLVPVSVQYPNIININESVDIIHAWKNTGIGFLPNNNARWGHKYKVSFALLDNTTNQVVHQFIESTDHVDPSTWLKEHGEKSYTSSMTLTGNVPTGQYKLAVAMVNTKTGNNPEINLAVKNQEKTDSGWYVLGSVEVE